MADETPSRSRSEGDSPHGGGGSSGQPAPLSARAAFLANWDWQSIIRLNERLCRGGKAQHGKNSETHLACAEEWTGGRTEERPFLETLDWLRSFHRKAPFLFFNGNTFAELARTLTDALFAEFPRTRRREAASLAAHYVAGVLDREPLFDALGALLEAADFQPGDRVRTLRGSLHGVVKSLIPDGRVLLQPDSGPELMALPESLVRAAQP